MDHAEILSRLKSSSKETVKSKNLRQQAVTLLSSEAFKGTETPGILQEILLSVVKPLFSVQQHPSLTSTGRKALVTAPSAGRFNNCLFDDEEETKPWKNEWTVDLLTFVFSHYRHLGQPLRKSTVESQFHLLVPPILNLIDDRDIKYKSEGCRLLRLLCNELVEIRSEILKRTGLTEVFSDALRTNFMLLPTLTPEEDALDLIRELYPAFRGLVDARFWPTRQHELPANIVTEHFPTIRPTIRNQASDKSKPASPLISDFFSKPQSIQHSSYLSEKDSRQSLLDLIFRQGVLASYAHASDYVKIATLLIQECRFVVLQMGIYAAKYLYQILPLLRSILSNPFGTAWPPLLTTALELMQTLIEVCWPRIIEAWWGECLRACVACFIVMEEDQKKGQIGNTKDLREIMKTVREVTALLADLVGEDFDTARDRLLKEDGRLHELLGEGATVAKDGSSQLEKLRIS